MELAGRGGFETAAARFSKTRIQSRVTEIPQEFSGISGVDSL
jgi:hypothetical protein